MQYIRLDDEEQGRLMTKEGSLIGKSVGGDSQKLYDSPSCALSIICCRSSSSSSRENAWCMKNIRASAWYLRSVPSRRFSSIHHMLGGLSTTNGKRTPGILLCRHALKCCIAYIYISKGVVCTQKLLSFMTQQRNCWQFFCGMYSISFLY